MRAGDRRRPYPRVYAVRSLVDLADPTLRLRTTVMAAQLALGGDAFAGGETAARLWGVEGLPAWDHRTVHMVLPGRGSHRHVPGITLHSWKTLPTEVTRLDGGALRVTTPVRTLADTLLGVDRETAVCLMDSAFHQGLVTPDHIPEMERANRGRR